MADRDFQSKPHKFPMASKGINRFKNIVELSPLECVTAQNCVFKNGIAKRDGQSKFEDDEVATGKKIVGLHRFYMKDGTKHLIAVSDTDVRRHDGATWQDIDTGQTTGLQTHIATWGALDKIYIANGTDTPFSWDGTTATDLSGTNFPSKAIQFLSYQDRLLHLDANNHGDLSWSKSFSDITWESISDVGVRPDSQLFGMIIHSVTNSDRGLESKVLLAGANGMYLFVGTALDPASSPDYRIDTVGIDVGCNAPRTMQWTPKGTMWLGSDKVVYLLPFNSNTPIPMSGKIFSNQTGLEGINDLPEGQIENACAAYHDGFYVLSHAASGQTINNLQWWLDVDRLQRDSDEQGGMWGPWYGPMKGQTISVFEKQAGPGDSGQLMAGEGDATTGSFVYEVHKSGVFADVSTAIQVFYQTFYNPLDDANMEKEVDWVEAELLDVLGTVSIDFHDIQGAVKTGDSISLSGSAIFWNDDDWDVNFWSSSTAVRQTVKLQPKPKVRRLSLLLSHNSSADKFEIYSLHAKTIEQNEVFA